MTKEQIEAAMDEIDHRVELLVLTKEELVNKIIILENALHELLDQLAIYEN